MPEENNTNPVPQENTPKEPIVYASPLKRIWAWVGVAYMLVIVALITYMLAYGKYLQGIGGLMICPALGGALVSLLYMWRGGERKGPGRAALLCLLAGACVALMILGLMAGVPGLIANFGA